MPLLARNLADGFTRVGKEGWFLAPSRKMPFEVGIGEDAWFGRRGREL